MQAKKNYDIIIHGSLVVGGDSCYISLHSSITVELHIMADISMKEKQENHKGHGIKYPIIGWILFILCAIFFIVSSLRNQDILTLIGSVR